MRSGISPFLHLLVEDTGINMGRGVKIAGLPEYCYSKLVVWGWGGEIKQISVWAPSGIWTINLSWSLDWFNYTPLVRLQILWYRLAPIFSPLLSPLIFVETPSPKNGMHEKNIGCKGTTFMTCQGSFHTPSRQHSYNLIEISYIQICILLGFFFFLFCSILKTGW